jgi:hypothetical protein
MKCSKCRRDTPALMPGGVCQKCYTPEPMPEPEPRQGLPRRRCLVRHKGLFVQEKHSRPRWGPRATARIFQSEALAGLSIKGTGKGKIKLLT